MKKTSDGTIDGKKVKIIVKLKNGIKEWFAKPKNKDIETPHFEERNGVLRVHQYSKDNKQYRIMKQPFNIESKTLADGLIIIPSENSVIVVPITIDNTGFCMETQSGQVIISSLVSGAQYLVAEGKWDEWKPKK